MTENEAIEVLKDEHSYGYELNKACLIAIQALSEIQQYRAIGTIEEFKDLKEKSVAKKPDFTEDKQFALCPNISCNSKGLKDKQQYCDKCGQKLDWQ